MVTGAGSTLVVVTSEWPFCGSTRPIALDRPGSALRTDPGGKQEVDQYNAFGNALSAS
jgi:hypothetical protein